MKRVNLICWLLILPLILCACGKENSTQTPTQMSFNELVALFNQEHKKFLGLFDDFNAAISYYKNNEIVSADEVHAYEERWMEMAQKTKTIKETLSVCIPPAAYEEAWTGYIDSIGKLSEVCLKGTNLTLNNGKEYTEEERTDLLIEIGEEYISTATEVQNSAIKLEEISAKSTTNNNENNDDGSGHSVHSCAECGIEANHSYINPFSGKLEYYCKKHYKEIVDTFSKMESDVGNSNQSKQTCEVCNREGTHIYHSFTGQTEHYCTEHYEELKNMLDAFGTD